MPRRYHCRMKSLGLAVVVAVALTLCGCDGKKGEKSEYDTGLKKLTTKDTVVGTGREATKDDAVFVLYKGTFIKDGKQFDSNMDDPESSMPFMVQFKYGGVIQGWLDGIPGMKEGGTRIIDIPYKDAYGDTGRDKIPPKADLRFEIKLLYVLKDSEKNVIDSVDTKVGSGPVAKEGDTVTIHYKGTYLSGKQWDNSRERGDPVTFPLKITEEGMPGLIYGIQGMKAGGVRTLVLPPSMAFGMSGSESVKGNQPIKIVVELLKVNGAGA